VCPWYGVNDPDRFLCLYICIVLMGDRLVFMRLYLEWANVEFYSGSLLGSKFTAQPVLAFAS